VPTRQQLHHSYGYCPSTAGPPAPAPLRTTADRLVRATRGLKFIAAQRTQRLSAIADWIGSSHGLDAVALQEIWTEEDYTVVSSRAKDAGLLYSRYFYR
jgi:hypothetical protein